MCTILVILVPWHNFGDSLGACFQALFLLFPFFHNTMWAIPPSSNQTDTMHVQGRRQLSQIWEQICSPQLRGRELCLVHKGINRSHTMHKNSLFVSNGDENGDLGTGPQKNKLSKCPPKRWKAPFCRKNYICFYH